ncbi:MAG: ABC transporter permease [Desulfurococcaceae archaeon]|jgi:ABC-2 type transport system permease protein
MVLTQLVKREIKAFLKNPGFIISLVILFAFYAAMGGIMRRSAEETQRIILQSNIGLVVEDNTAFVQELVKTINETLGGRVKIYSNIREAVEDTGVGLLIPRGFTTNITNNLTTLYLSSMVKIDSPSTTIVQAKTSILSQLASLIEHILPYVVSKTLGYEISGEYMVSIHGSALFYGREVDSALLMGFLTFITMLPLLVGILIGTNAGYAAQLVAYEKLEKAFEMLLAQPIKRSSIVIAKIIGASVATIIYSAVILASIFILALGSIPGEVQSIDNSVITSSITELSRQLGLDVAFHFIVSIAIALILGLLETGSLGIILGSMASDERTAGLLITPVMFLYLGLAFAFTFIGFQVNIATSVLAGFIVLPLPMVYMLSLISGETIYIVVSLASSIAVCILLTSIAVFLFNRDIVVLGLRIRLRRE